ncbi:putative pectinesterase [Diaporthe ampelina]|uniref:Pectinesterase n=1 Tax=Diaporthe ampelina TaxID=1214573 RepID=A0A0G2HNW7_9PEZI|nr:putative pectinesterase [Diaporthe ampelina]
MTLKKSFVVVAELVVAVLAAARTSPPSGSITVCSSGCNYNTIQKAVSSISTSSKDEHSIFIYSGTYAEQVTIPVLSGKLNIYGYTKDTSDYSGNVVNLQWESALATGAADDEHTAALINTSPNVAVYNINIKNTYGKPSGSGGQAIALSAYNTEQGYYGVGLYGYQDTLLAQTGNQIYAHSYIEGAVDFIFGQHARAWITNSRVVSVGAGAITASGRASDSDTSYYVITDSTIEAGSPAAGRGRRLPRPAVGPHVSVGEYGNTGAGAGGTRASFSSGLSSALSIATVLGGDYAEWVDPSYL